MSNIQDSANQALEQLLNVAVSGVQGAVNFSKAQIPDVIHQMLVWNAVTSLNIQVVCLIALTVTLILIYKFIKYYDFDGEAVVFGILIGSIPVVPVLIIFFHNSDWLQIWLAPKYYILQQAASLVKG